MTFANLHIIDWCIVLAYMVLILWIGMKFTKKAGKDMTGFFLSGRSLPWWLAGTSVVAGHFSVSYPIKTIMMVRQYGIEHVWIQWYMIPAAMIGAVFLAKLWRRAKIITSVELVRIRFSGRVVHFLNCFQAIYDGIFRTLFFTAMSFIALEKVIEAMLPGVEPKMIIFAICVVALAYSIMSGLYAVVITDFIQFIFAGIGSIVLVVLVYHHVGSPAQLIEEVQAVPGKETATHIIPESPPTAAARPVRHYLYRTPIRNEDAVISLEKSLKEMEVKYSTLVNKYILLEEGASAYAIRTTLLMQNKFPEGFSVWSAIGLGNWEKDVFLDHNFYKDRCLKARAELMEALRLHLVAMDAISDARVYFKGPLSSDGSPDMDAKPTQLEVQLALASQVMDVPVEAQALGDAIAADLGLNSRINTPAKLMPLEQKPEALSKTTKAWLDYVGFLLYILLLWFFDNTLFSGGGDPQRLMASRSERDSMLMLVCANIIERGLTFWLWIIIALGSLVMLGGDSYDHQKAYAAMGLTFLPIGLKGVFVASIFAALMSTVDTNINMSAGFMVNDLYKQYIKKDGDARHYVKAARVATALSLLIAFLMWYGMLSGTQILDNFKVVGMLLAGAALPQFFQWFWWRVNGWTIVSAMSASIFVTAMLKFVLPAHVEWFRTYKLATDYWPIGVLVVVVFSTICWVTVTLLTQPTDMEKLKEFYKRVRPIGFWGPVRKALEEEAFSAGASNLRNDLMTWISAVVAIFSFVFGLGKMLLGSYLLGCTLLMLFVVATYTMLKIVSRNEWWYKTD